MKHLMLMVFCSFKTTLAGIEPVNTTNGREIMNNCIEIREHLGNLGIELWMLEEMPIDNDVVYEYNTAY